MNQNQNIFMNLRVIHFAMITGPSALLAISYFSLAERELLEIAILSQLGIAIAILAGIAAIFAPIYFAKQLKNNSDKEVKYQTVKIVQWAIIEAAAIMNALSYFLTGNIESAGISVAMILLLASRFPNKTEMDKIFTDKPSYMK
jgi:predicted transporter